jgi:hypothetical protein
MSRIFSLSSSLNDGHAFHLKSHQVGPYKTINDGIQHIVYTRNVVRNLWHQHPLALWELLYATSDYFATLRSWRKPSGWLFCDPDILEKTKCYEGWTLKCMIRKMPSDSKIRCERGVGSCVKTWCLFCALYLVMISVEISRLDSILLLHHESLTCFSIIFVKIYMLISFIWMQILMKEDMLHHEINEFSNKAIAQTWNLVFA